MNNDNMKANESERIGKLETAVEGIRADFDSLDRKVEKVLDAVNRSQRTDWQTIFAGLIVIGALWASAIRPINADVEKQAVAAAKLAEAVLVQNKSIGELQVDLRGQSRDMASMEKDIDLIRQYGTPVTDKRITVLEYRMGEVQPEKSIPAK